MAPLLVPFLLSFLFYPFAQDIVPKAEDVIGRRIPDVELTLEDGRTFRLSQVAKDRAVLLSFIYTRCTLACPMIVKGIKKAVADLRGRDYRVLIVDFDERDGVNDLVRFRTKEGLDESWVVALAKGQDLSKLTRSLDFKFFYDEKTDMFAHPNVLVVLSPELKVVAYFLGVSYDGSKLAKAVDKAYTGGTLLDPIKGLLLKCFRYDPITGTYTIDWSFVAMIVGGLIPIAGMFYYIVLRDLISSLRRAVQ